MKYPEIENHRQDRSTKAWLKLEEYINLVCYNELEEFSPREYLGNDLFKEIHTLPESIEKLNKVKKIWLYGSSLTSIPPQIGKMESLEYFDLYTSYDLKWFPYEIIKCIALKDSRISTRALFGNFKNKKPFPDLSNNSFRYYSGNMICSSCRKVIENENVDQYWISKLVATDVIPLLVNVCSESCKDAIDKDEVEDKYYINCCHKGGDNVPKAKVEREEYLRSKGKMKIMTIDELKKISEKKNRNIILKPLKLVKKIWEK